MRFWKHWVRRVSASRERQSCSWAASLRVWGSRIMTAGGSGLTAPLTPRPETGSALISINRSLHPSCKHTLALLSSNLPLSLFTAGDLISCVFYLNPMKGAEWSGLRFKYVVRLVNVACDVGYVVMFGSSSLFSPRLQTFVFLALVCFLVHLCLL